MHLKQHLEQIKDNKLGVAILTVGILAVLGVFILIFQTMRPATDSGQGPVLSQDEIQAFKEQSQPVAEVQKAPPHPKKTFKRQKTVSEEDILGAWDARLDTARAIFQLKNGTYQLVIIPDDPILARYYSNGTYTLKDDLLMLEPNLDWGPPKSQRYVYSVLTRSEMPVSVLKYKGQLIWQLPGSDAGVYVPPYHPVLSEVQDNIAVWNVLK
ncbi:MAG TPA: hypothetical protein PLF01_08130 [Alphaproteobacteria bacterium]|nr:hypothetical protein [Alphaproteobacteria bacterium]